MLNSKSNKPSSISNSLQASRQNSRQNSTQNSRHNSRQNSRQNSIDALEGFYGQQDKDKRPSLASTGSSGSDSPGIPPKSISLTNVNKLKRPNLERAQLLTGGTNSPVSPPTSGTPNFKITSPKSTPQTLSSKRKQYKVTDRKTLVDQFYSIEDTGPIKTEEFQAIEYNPIDSHIQHDPELTNYLLNIDTIVKDLYHKESDDPQLTPMLPLIRTISSINQTLNDFSDGSKSNNNNGTTLDEINKLTQYLKHLNTSIDQLHELLILNVNKVKLKYQPEISKIVIKLNDLLLTLDNLESRLETIRSQTNSSKLTISQDLLDKVELLEHIDNKFREYSDLNRKKRFKQLNITLSILVVVLSVYWIWGG